MRRLSVLMFSLSLAVSSQGCHKTLRHTAGVCDCYPPPVETLLQAPCPRPGHPSSPVSGAYAPAPYAHNAGNQPTAIHMHPGTGNAQPLPLATTPTPPVVVPKESESIRILPKIGEDKKDKP